MDTSYLIIRQILNDLAYYKDLLLTHYYIIQSLTGLMPSIKKNRTHKSLSSYLSSLNKENYLDFANRVPNPKKGIGKMVSEDPVLVEHELRQSKQVYLKPLPPLNLQPKENTMLFEEKMKLGENNMIARNYGLDILDTLLENNRKERLTNILFTHNIPKDLRCRMIDWMIEVIGAFKFDQQSFFTAVRIMDTFFMKTTKTHQPQEVHLTGVTCMYVATKFEEVHPLKLKTVFEKIGHRKLSTDSILTKESEILESLDFTLTGVNHYEILSQILFMTKLEQRIDKKFFTYLRKVCLYLSKMVLFEMEIMTNYDYATIAIANLYVAFKTIEQGYPGFDPDVEIREGLEFVDVRLGEMMETATKILQIAKSFDKVHHNLKNLKKFNGFSFDQHERERGEKPTTTR